MNSLRPSSVVVPLATSVPSGSYSSMCGSSLLSCWLGPSTGVLVSRRRKFSVLVTSTGYQSSSLPGVISTSSTYQPSYWLPSESIVSNEKRIWTVWPANAARLADTDFQTLVSGSWLLLVLDSTVVNVTKLLVLTWTLATSK